MKRTIALLIMILLAGSVSAGAGCYATRVVSFDQGLTKGGSAVVAERSDSSKALGAPQGTDVVNFVSLGFGGEIVLEFECPIVNPGDGEDLSITETSYGSPSCANYPEKARVYASKDGSSWTDLGQICQDGEVDLGSLDWARYIKLVDESEKASSRFPQAADGYDVDGLIGRHCECGHKTELPEFTSLGIPLLILLLAPGLASVLARKMRS